MAPNDPNYADEKDAGDLHTNAFTCLVDHFGTTVHAKAWTKSEALPHPLVIVHDIGEDSTFYRDVAKQWVNLGINTYCFDLRGHGRSGRSLGHINSFSELTNDLLQVSAWVKHQSKGHAPIILGVGFGALISLFFQPRFPNFCHKLVLCAPTMKLRHKVTPWRRFIISRLADLLPGLRLPIGLLPRSARYFSSAEKVATLAPSKNLHAIRVSAKFSDQLLNAMDRSQARFLKISTDTLVLVPNEDAFSTYQFLDDLVARHKINHRITVKKISTSCHNLLLEDESINERCINTIHEWITQDGKLPTQS